MRTNKNDDEETKRKRILEVCGKAGSDTGFLGRGVDADKNEVGLSDGVVDVGGEKEIATACLADDGLETGFIDRELVVGTVPGVDAILVEVDDGDLDMRTLERNDSARRAPYKVGRMSVSVE